jgi:hypothetical protein
MSKLENIINALKKSDAIYSISYWTTGNEEMLKRYAETEYFWGCAYHNGDISITRWAIDNSDLEEWLAVGLTDEEVSYIAKEVR